MTPQETKQIFRLILGVWPSQRSRMSAEDIRTMAEGYAAGLADLDFEHAKQAISRLARTHEWIPTIAAIRQAVGVVVVGQQKTGMEAWGEVHYAIRRYGSHRTPGDNFSFKDPITALVVKQIGWFDICASHQPDHIRARFIDAYDSISHQERVEAQASPGAVVPLLSRTERHEQALTAGDAARNAMRHVLLVEPEDH